MVNRNLYKKLEFNPVSDCSGQPLGWLRNEVEQ